MAEDKKEAAKMAADAAKTLITIAVAASGVCLGYFQFMRGQQLFSGLAIGLTAVALALFLFSMISGMCVVSGIYKRGEGRTTKASWNGVLWSTSHVAGWINGQAITGLVGLIAFGVAVYLSTENVPSRRWTIDAPEREPPIILTGKTITIFGSWNELFVRDERSSWIRLKNAPSGERRVIELRQE